MYDIMSIIPHSCEVRRVDKILSPYFIKYKELKTFESINNITILH